MAAPLYYKAVISFYQGKALSLFSHIALKTDSEQLREPLVITCKSPVGLTREERYQQIKALMNK